DWAGLPGPLPLPPPRPPPVPPPAAAGRRPLALSLAHLPHHARGGPDQAPRGPLLARPHLPLLALRDAADPESAQPPAALRASLVPPAPPGVPPPPRAGCRPAAPSPPPPPPTRRARAPC